MPGHQRYAAIVETAIRLFAEKGFRGTTTRDLAAAVGVTEPVLYIHFRNKRELYDAVVETKVQEGRDQVARLLGPYQDGQDDRSFFTRLGELLLEKYEQDPAYVRLLLFSALERHEVAELFYERQLLDFQRQVVKYIERRVREGAFRAVDPLIAARAFVGMIAHHGLMGVLFPDRVPHTSRKKIVQGVVDILMKGLSERRDRRAL